MQGIDVDSMSGEQLAQAYESAEQLLRHLESKKADARDEELVWVENPSGRPDVCKRGLWRTHLSRQSEKGWRLLEPDEIEDQQDAVEQARIQREEKIRLWTQLAPRDRTNREGVSDRAGWQEYSVEELQQMVNDSTPFSTGKASDDEMRKKVEALEAKIAELTDKD